MKRISVFGATGSIGQNTLDLIQRNPDRFDVVALSGGNNIAQLAQDAKTLGAKIAVTAYEDRYAELKDALAGTSIDVAAGADAIVDSARRPVDIAVSAIVGAAGLASGLATLKQGATLALANKESMVAAGRLMRSYADTYGGQILPVDSEHSALFQALIGEDITAVERVIITASGGAFRDWTLEEIAKATPEQAATHPNWDMGQRITIDSASMFNKSLEIIEAKELFDFSPRQIEVLIHPQSMIHAMIGFRDGGLMAHIGPADMRHAIGFALNWPDRGHIPVERLDFAKIGRFDFVDPDLQKYPALRLAYDVMEKGGLSGAVYNAAKEIALDAFIAKRIGFLEMAQVVERVLEHMDATQNGDIDATCLDNVLMMDQMGRKSAADIIAKI